MIFKYPLRDILKAMDRLSPLGIKWLPVVAVASISSAILCPTWYCIGSTVMCVSLLSYSFIRNFRLVCTNEIAYYGPDVYHASDKMYRKAVQQLVIRKYDTITVYVSRDIYTMMYTMYVQRADINLVVDPYMKRLEYGFTRKNEMITEPNKFFEL